LVTAGKRKKKLKVPKEKKEQQKVFSKCRFTPTHVSINLGQTKMEEKKEKMN
jgi:hypothetical protein